MDAEGRKATRDLSENRAPLERGNESDWVRPATTEGLQSVWRATATQTTRDALTDDREE